MPLEIELKISLPNINFNVSDNFHGEISMNTIIIIQHPYNQFKHGALLADTNY